MNGVRGTRGKKKSKPIETHDKSTTQLVSESGKYYECFDCEDRSLTKQQHLRLFSGKRASLLNKGNPFPDVDNLHTKRELSKSKRVVVDDTPIRWSKGRK